MGFGLLGSNFLPRVEYIVFREFIDWRKAGVACLFVSYVSLVPCTLDGEVNCY